METLSSFDTPSGRAVFRWQRTLAKNPLGVAPDMYTPKCAPQRAPCSGAVYLACFASAHALGPGNSQVPPSHAPIIWHKIKTKRSHTRYTSPLDSVFCALYFGVSLFTQLFVSFWESWCQVFCFFDQTFSSQVNGSEGILQAKVCLCSVVVPSFPCLRACQHDNFERKCHSH